MSDGNRPVAALLEMARPVIGGITATGAVTALWMVSSQPEVGQMAFLALVLLFVTSGGFILNDVSDLEKDRICHPKRPLPQGRVSRRTAAFWGWALLLGGLICALPLGLPAAYLVGLNVTLLASYSKLLRADGFLANLVTSYLAASIVLVVMLVAGRGGQLLPAGIVVFLVMLAREIVFDIRDLPGDSAAGIRTLVARVGPRWALAAAWVTLALAVLTTALLLPYASHWPRRWLPSASAWFKRRLLRPPSTISCP